MGFDGEREGGSVEVINPGEVTLCGCHGRHFLGRRLESDGRWKKCLARADHEWVCRVDSLQGFAVKEVTTGVVGSTAESMTARLFGQTQRSNVLFSGRVSFSAAQHKVCSLLQHRISRQRYISMVAWWLASCLTPPVQLPCQNCLRFANFSN